VFVYSKRRKKRKPAPMQTMNNTAWQRARTGAGLGDLHVHDLRHTVGMWLREAGVREETIADILWHSRRGMTAHYSMAQIVEIRHALELITDERNCFNKSLASLIREKSSQKVPKANRVGGGVTPAVLPHHRTCGSAYGGSGNTLEATVCNQ